MAKAVCQQCKYYLTNGCRNVSPNDGACAKFEKAKKK